MNNCSILSLTALFTYTVGETHFSRRSHGRIDQQRTPSHHHRSPCSECQHCRGKICPPCELALALVPLFNETMIGLADRQRG